MSRKCQPTPTPSHDLTATEPKPAEWQYDYGERKQHAERVDDVLCYNRQSVQWFSRSRPHLLFSGEEAAGGRLKSLSLAYQKLCGGTHRNSSRGAFVVKLDGTAFIRTTSLERDVVMVLQLHYDINQSRPAMPLKASTSQNSNEPPSTHVLHCMYSLSCALPLTVFSTSRRCPGRSSNNLLP